MNGVWVALSSVMLSIVTLSLILSAVDAPAVVSPCPTATAAGSFNSCARLDVSQAVAR